MYNNREECWEVDVIRSANSWDGLVAVCCACYAFTSVVLFRKTNGDERKAQFLSKLFPIVLVAGQQNHVPPFNSSQDLHYIPSGISSFCQTAKWNVKLLGKILYTVV